MPCRQLGKRSMFELSVVQRKADDSTVGLGNWIFAVVPQLMDTIVLPGPVPGLNFYEVIRIEHHPIIPDATRPRSAKNMPSVSIEVRFSHDQD